MSAASQQLRRGLALMDDVERALNQFELSGGMHGAEVSASECVRVSTALFRIV
jgi:hypothetical protein